MRIKCLILLAMLSLVFGSANAGLLDPPITDPSFESVENGTDHDLLNDPPWGYVIDEWFENEYPDYLACYWQFGSEIGLIADGDMWAGTETGGAFYQAIGTVDDEVTYTVKALIGDRGGSSFGTGSFSIYAGGDSGSGADGLALDSFATLLDSVRVTTTDGTLVSTNVYEVEVQLLSGTGYGGQILWLQVKSVLKKNYFDRIEITSSDMASDPVPADGDVLVPADQVMSWTPPTAYIPLGYDVYFSTDPNLPETAKVVDGLNVTSYDPDSDLEFSTDYYWRVNPIDPNDGSPSPVRGSLWTFTTMPAEPTITADPESITVPLTSTAEFTVEDIRGTDYQWYLVNPDPEGDDYELEGEISSTYSISNVQVGDEGYYYCIVSNGNGEATSEQARLMVQRLVGHWKLDGDLTNEVPGGGDGALTDPNFATGIDGSGLEFLGDDTRPVIITGSEEYYNFYPQGMTVSVWVKTNTSSWDGVIAKQQRYETWSGWTIDVNNRYGNGGWAHFTVRTNNNLWGTDNDEDIFDGDWHLITGVIDPVTNTYRIYIDGGIRNENTLTVAPTTHQEPLIFGQEALINEDGYLIPYTGLLDEVRIWNYPLDILEIAQQYVDYYPSAEVCVEPLDLDFNGNCMIDIDDFASIAAAWLECNMVPESECL